MKTTVDYNTLLTREEFKELGFRRTEGKCCVPGCCENAVDAHHIMDRKLWKNGGYFLSNCAPVCEKHHLDCEAGAYTPRQVMEFAKIPMDELQKPSSFDWMTDEEYRDMFMNEDLDKFGILVNGNKEDDE